MVFAFAALVAGALLFIPTLIAPRRLTPVKSAPFECGKDPIAVTAGPLRHQVLPDRHHFHHHRPRAPVHPGRGPRLFRQLGLFGFVEDARVPVHPDARVRLRLAQGRPRMGVGSFFTSKLDEAIGWARKYSIFQYPFVTSVLRDGVHGDGVLALRRRSVRRRAAALLAPAGRRALRRRHDQPQDGAGAQAHLRPDDRAEVGRRLRRLHVHGGFYDNYATVQGIDTIIRSTSTFPAVRLVPSRSSTGS